MNKLEYVFRHVKISQIKNNVVDYDHSDVSLIGSNRQINLKLAKLWVVIQSSAKCTAYIKSFFQFDVYLFLYNLTKPKQN